MHLPTPGTTQAEVSVPTPGKSSKSDLEAVGRHINFRGNNVFSYINGQTVAQSAAGQIFNYQYNTGQDPRTGYNPAASAVNAFYGSNSVHDFAYRYGFTERAFNFQANNFGRGGTGNDPVLITVQSTEGWNNAYFSTPPE